MSIAFEVLRCWELLGGVPTGPDLEALVAGAVAEGNADVAVELADRSVGVVGGLVGWLVGWSAGHRDARGIRL